MKIRAKFFNVWSQRKLSQTSYLFNFVGIKFYWLIEFKTLEIHFILFNFQLVVFIG